MEAWWELPIPVGGMAVAGEGGGERVHTVSFGAEQAEADVFMCPFIGIDCAGGGSGSGEGSRESQTWFEGLGFGAHQLVALGNI